MPVPSLRSRASAVALVGAGGFCGAAARYGVGLSLSGTFPCGTLLANVPGSFALGVSLALPIGDSVRLPVVTGFCGAFTTFSTFAFETVRLYETGDRREALGNATLNLVGALVAVGFGTALATAFG